MRLGQRLFNLLKAAKGERVPVSHLVAVTKADRQVRAVSIEKMEPDGAGDRLEVEVERYG